MLKILIFFNILIIETIIMALACSIIFFQSFLFFEQQFHRKNSLGGVFQRLSKVKERN
jgi:hypothetical protein